MNFAIRCHFYRPRSGQASLFRKEHCEINEKGEGVRHNYRTKFHSELFVSSGGKGEVREREREREREAFLGKSTAMTASGTGVLAHL